MSAPLARPLPKAVIGVVLMLGGMVCAGMWRVVSASEHQPYAPGATPPSVVHVTRDKTYHLAVPGGVSALVSAGVAPIAAPRGGSDVVGLQCVWAEPGRAAQSLAVSGETVDSKAVNQVGAFNAPVTGRIKVRCQDWGTMFVPDADGHPGDPAGWYLVSAVVLLTVGVGLGLSALRTGGGGHTEDRSTDDDDRPDGYGAGDDVNADTDGGPVYAYSYADEPTAGGDDRDDGESDPGRTEA
jgi:hypothetical protein